MVVWSDGKPMTVLKARHGREEEDEDEEETERTLPFQYKIPLSRYNTLACAANRSRKDHRKAARPQQQKEEPLRHESSNTKLLPRQPVQHSGAPSGGERVYFQSRQARGGEPQAMKEGTQLVVEPLTLER